ncbi:MAG: oligosaccharide flippase family protein [Deltaproteobacteria bacterium]|nr:oligosaccharide flippase family protein [Deltaproteobacteria bacterium]
MKHLTRYFFGTVASQVFAFAFLVVFSKILAVEDFGALTLILNVVALLSGFVALGLPQAVVRFFPHYEEQASEAQKRFYGTVFGGGLLLGCGALCGLLLVVKLFPLPSFIISEERWCWATVAVLFGVLIEIAMCVLRAQHASSAFNILLGLRKMLLFTFGFVLLMGFSKHVLLLLQCFCLAEASVCVLAMLCIVRGNRSALSIRIDGALFRNFVAYGWPHAVVISGVYLLSVGDRFVVHGLLSAKDTGVFVAGSTIASALASVLTRPTNLFLFPTYSRMCAKQGVQRTGQYLSNLILQYCVVAVLLGILLSSIAPWVIPIMTSAEYASAAGIFPLLLVGQLVSGLINFSASGMYMSQRPYGIAITALGAALLNVFLNMYLIPHYGLYGAGIASICAMTANVVVSGVISRAWLPIPYPWWDLAKVGASGALGWSVGHLIVPHVQHWFLAALVLAVEILIYGVAIMALSKRLRSVWGQWIVHGIHAIRTRSRQTLDMPATHLRVGL